MKNIFLFIQTYSALVIFLALQIVCIVFLSHYSKTHEAYFASAVNEVTGRIDSKYNNFSGYFILKDVNRQLEEENTILRNELKSNYISIDSSKKLHTDSIQTGSVTKYRKYYYLSARVVNNSVSSQNNYITLERGANQGIKKGMSVIGPAGIVGVVTEVSNNYSLVMSLLHHNSKVSAMLKKDDFPGSLEWDGADPSYLILKNIPKSEKVSKGDTVLTSYYSTNFPSNLMIGTIADFTSDPSSNFYTIKVKTAVNFYTLQYVNVIDNRRADEQAQLEQKKVNE
jgi:rod shape-determining protein MreC